MPRILDTTQETANSWSPYKVETKEFVQQATIDYFAALIKVAIGTNYDPTVPYVIDGCVLSGGGTDITAGRIFYNNAYYDVSALTGASVTPIKFKINAYPDPLADPTIFSDNTSHNIHTRIDIQAVNGNSTGTIFSANDLVPINLPLWTTVGSGGSAPAYQNSWSAVTSTKFLIDGNGIVRIIGIAQKAGAITTSVPIFTLPTGYRPVNDIVIPCMIIDSGTQKIGAVTITSAGFVYPLTSFIAGSTITYVYFDSISFYTG